MDRRRAWSVLLLRVASTLACGLGPVACHRAGPPADAAVGPPRAATIARQASLETGLILVDVLAPLEPRGAKAAVIMPAGLALPIVEAGAVAVWYRIDWSRLGDEVQPPSDLSDTGAGGQPAPARTRDVPDERFFHRVAIAADAVVPRIVDWLETLPEVDPDRLGLVGIGADAVVALTAAAREPRIAAVAAPFACGDWERLLLGSAVPDGSGATVDPEWRRWLRVESPLADPRRLVPAPVLLASRPDDAFGPPSCVDATADALRAAYVAEGAGDRLQRLQLTGDDDARAACLAWMDRWLLRR